MTHVSAVVTYLLIKIHESHLADSDLGLILGLSLGLGIPILLGVLGIIIYSVVKRKPREKYLMKDNNYYDLTTEPAANYDYYDQEASSTYF